MQHNRLNEVVFRAMTEGMSYSLKARLEIYNQRRHEMLWLACLAVAIALLVPGFIFSDFAPRVLLLGYGFIFLYVMIVALKNQFHNRRIWREIMDKVHQFEGAFCLNASCKTDLMKGQVTENLISRAKEILNLQDSINRIEEEARRENRLKQVKKEVSEKLEKMMKKREEFESVFNLVETCTGKFVHEGRGYRCFYDSAKDAIRRSQSGIGFKPMIVHMPVLFFR